uniref:Purple acid phosphatase n=1 Tax=Eutreptiella gymnastica TaxID=73025 RepID=A0A7S1N1W9_9EUGL|mmetsp:Transcript_107245/g.185007  ORF Transcript_107245/g.185007 Transcript_107245/m.185007 type:complete len:711 (+) Transcript_107245:33-2165(+)
MAGQRGSSGGSSRRGLGCLGAVVVVLMLWVATLFQPEPGHEGSAVPLTPALKVASGQQVAPVIAEEHNSYSNPISISDPTSISKLTSASVPDGSATPRLVIPETTIQQPPALPNNDHTEAVPKPSTPHAQAEPPLRLASVPGSCKAVDPAQQVPRSCPRGDPLSVSSAEGASKLTLDMTVLSTQGTIAAQWAVSNATAFDMVAVFAPDFILSAKRINVADVKAGAGTVHFELLNLRLPLTVKYLQFKLVLMEIGPICGELNTPMYPHLGLTGTPSTLALMFISGRDATPAVQYGPDKQDLGWCATGTSTTYNVTELGQCKRGGHRGKSWARSYFIDPGHIHTVYLSNLSPGQRYWYRFGSPLLQDGWSGVYSFVAPDNSPRPFSFVAFGDMGTATWEDMKRFPDYWDCPEAHSTANRLSAQLTEDKAPPFEFVMHLGDISYAVGYAPRWEQFHHLVTPVASAVPYLVLDGNHDIGEDSFGECGVPFFKRFHFPKSPNASLPYYSFDYGYMHMIVVSTEYDPAWEPTTMSYKWLVDDLASVNRSKTPWVFIAGHRTLYTSDVHWTRVRESWKMQATLEPLMQKYGAVIYMGGHVHNYERSCWVKNRKCLDGETTGGVIGIQMGTAGSRTHPRDFSTEQPTWSARRHSHNGYGVFHITQDRAEFKFIRSHDGRDHDHFVLHQKDGAVTYENLFSNDDEALKRLGGMVGKQFR